MLKSVLVAIFATLSSVIGTAPSIALSAAEFLQANPEFSAGYAMGVVDFRTTVINDGETERSPDMVKLGKCMVASGIKANTFYEAVVAFIKAHPERLARSATGSVLAVAFTVCPR